MQPDRIKGIISSHFEPKTPVVPLTVLLCNKAWQLSNVASAVSTIGQFLQCLNKASTTSGQSQQLEPWEIALAKPILDSNLE
jgi:hypothetical protein